MKKFITPILVIIGFFALMYAALASTDRTTVHCHPNLNSDCHRKLNS